jgi:hypothetical protein
MPVKILAAPKVYTWKLDNINGGLNLEDNPYQLLDNQAQDCKNVYYNQTFCKRPGTRSLNVTAAGTPILSMYDYLYKGVLVFSTGTKLCTMNPTLTSYTTVYTGLTAAKGTFFKYNGFLYYINGHEFVKFDGTTCTSVLASAYVPVTRIGMTPTGGGTANEDYNRLSAGFTNWIKGDGTSTAFQLTQIGLDATTVTATVNGIAKVEGTGFTVNRTTGVVTFTTAPSLPATTNNVTITAYKTDTADLNYLLQCTVAIAFGGADGNRVFFAGNNTANYYFTGAADPSYFPMGQVNNVGQNDDPISQMAIQNDTMIILKQRSIYGMTYGGLDTNSPPRPQFPVVSLNSNIGCDCPKTVQLVNNKLVWLTSYGGVYVLVNQTTAIINDNVYRNVNQLSRNINGNARRQGLLQESNITSAVAVNFNNKYWVAVNGKVYLWDYGLTPYNSQNDTDKAQKELAWWVFDSLPISCFAQDTVFLYFGDTVSGLIELFENTFVDATTHYQTLNNSAATFSTGTSDASSIPISFIDGLNSQLAFNGSASGNIVNPQFKSTGKNLFNPVAGTVTFGGVTCTVASDGTITLNGTATGPVFFEIFPLLQNGTAVNPTALFNLVLNSKYTLSETILSGTKSLDLSLTLFDTAGYAGANKIFGISSNVCPYTMTAGVINSGGASTLLSVGFFGFNIPSGAVFTNYTFKLQLEQNGLSLWEQYKSSLLTITGTIGTSDRFTWDGATGKINGSAVSTSGSLTAYLNGNIFVQNSNGTPATVVPTSEISYLVASTSINAYWQMGTNHFDSPNLLKTIRKWWCSVKSDTPETIGITYFTDQNEGGVADSQPISIDALFDWNNWDWDNFSWGSDPWFNEPMRKPIARSTKSFSLKLSNNVAGEDLNASNINIQYVVVKEVK